MALTSSEAMVLSASKVTVAVFLAKSIRAWLTTGTFYSDFLTETGHSSQVMFCMCSVALCVVAAQAANDDNAIRIEAIEWRMEVPSERLRRQPRHRQQRKECQRDDPKDHLLAFEDDR